MNASDVKETVAEASGSTRSRSGARPFGTPRSPEARRTRRNRRIRSTRNPPPPPPARIAANRRGTTRSHRSRPRRREPREGGFRPGAAPPPGSRLNADPTSPKSPKSAMGADRRRGRRRRRRRDEHLRRRRCLPTLLFNRLVRLVHGDARGLAISHPSSAPVMPARSCLMRSGASFALLRNFTASSGATRPCLPPGASSRGRSTSCAPRRTCPSPRGRGAAAWPTRAAPAWPPARRARRAPAPATSARDELQRRLERHGTHGGLAVRGAPPDLAERLSGSPEPLEEFHRVRSGDGAGTVCRVGRRVERGLLGSGGQIGRGGNAEGTFALTPTTGVSGERS